MRASCVPPGNFVDLHKGTWHAGPLWGPDPTPKPSVFNLEQHDTNLSDHISVHTTDATFGGKEGAPVVVSLDTNIQAIELHGGRRGPKIM